LKVNADTLVNNPSRHIRLKKPASAHSLKYSWMLLAAPYSLDSASH
jgi:hypothetical protein